MKITSVSAWSLELYAHIQTNKQKYLKELKKILLFYYFHAFQYVSEKFSGIFFTLQIVTDCCIQNVHLNILSIAYLTLIYKAFFFGHLNVLNIYHSALHLDPINIVSLKKSS